MPDGTDTLYLCGNSLGLQSKDGIDALHAVVKDWAELGIEGYFTGDNPWVDYGTELRESESAPRRGQAAGSGRDELVDGKPEPATSVLLPAHAGASQDHY